MHLNKLKFVLSSFFGIISGSFATTKSNKPEANSKTITVLTAIIKLLGL